MKNHVTFLYAIVALACLTSAEAAKEQFVRNKPHVNVGTIGKTESEPATNIQSSGGDLSWDAVGHGVSGLLSEVLHELVPQDETEDGQVDMADYTIWLNNPYQRDSSTGVGFEASVQIDENYQGQGTVILYPPDDEPQRYDVLLGVAEEQEEGGLQMTLVLVMTGEPIERENLVFATVTPSSTASDVYSWEFDGDGIADEIKVDALGELEFDRR